MRSHREECGISGGLFIQEVTDKRQKANVLYCCQIEMTVNINGHVSVPDQANIRTRAEDRFVR
jgi:hypothetical protein